MAFDFPTSPTVGQNYNGYVWDGEKWKLPSGSVIYVSDTPPSGAADGALWFESDSGRLFVYFNDGTSKQWVNIPGGVFAPGHLPGEPSNGSAAAGEVGEYAETGVIASPALVNNVQNNITSMIIPPGDWDLSAGYFATGSTNPTVTDIWVSLNTTISSGVNTPLQSFRARGWTMQDPVTSGALGPLRVSTAIPVTWYLNCLAAFSAGAFTISGNMRRRRAR